MSALSDRGGRTGVTVAGLIVLLLLLAACSSAAQPSPGKASDTINWAEYAGLTPTWILPFYVGGTEDGTNIMLIQSLYRPLYAFGSNKNANVNEPLSLAQLPSWSADGKTATIVMKDYRWSNGQPVTANDVLFDINVYMAEKANNSNYIPGGIPDNIVSARATNAHTLVITTNEAYNQKWFLYNELSQLTPWPAAWDLTSAGQPSDCAADEADCAAVYNYLDTQAKRQSTYSSNPLWAIVDGPWTLKSYESDGYVSLLPNRHYSGPVKPSVKQFNMLPFTSDSAEFNVLNSGKTLDIGYIPTQDLSSPHPTGASPVTPGPNPLSSRYKLAPAVSYGFDFIPLNFNGPQGALVRQLYFRQTLQSLVDQSAILTSAAKGYGLASLGPVPTFPVSPLVSPNERHNLYPFSIAKAKAYLSHNGWTVKPGGVTTCAKAGTVSGDCGAGIAAGTPLTFDLPYATGSQTLTTEMESLKSNAEKVGIKFSLHGVSVNTAIADYTTPCQTGSAACNWTIADWGGSWTYGPDYYPTGETLFSTGSQLNGGSYSNPLADKYIQETLTSNSPSAFIDYEQLLAHDLPVIYEPNTDLELNEVGNGLQGVAPIPPLGSQSMFPAGYHY